MSEEVKRKIKEAIRTFAFANTKSASEYLLTTLGYRSNKKANVNLGSLKKRASDRNVSYSQWDELKSAELIFQITDDEVKSGNPLFNVVNEDLYQSYLFFAVELNGKEYSRGQLSRLTRFINRLYDMPVMVFFRYDTKLTLSVIDRRPQKRDTSKDVLEKITLIKDINIVSVHRAHTDILYDLHFNNLFSEKKEPIKNFQELHEAWQKILDTKELNRKFYEELFKWYLWAVKNVKFPQIRPKEDLIPDEAHQSESVIRLLTRLLFCWFMKEKQELIPEILFDINKVKKLLKHFEPEKNDNAVYYRAILQNLFFATLNVPIRDRKYIRESFQGKNTDHGNQYVFRYQDEFVNPKENLRLFKDVPFLNGGLFDCLDKRKDDASPEEVRLDGFSTNEKKQAFVPDFLFWGEYKGIDLSKEFDNPRKNNETVHGIFDILNAYKFTIEENTPIEEEIALDPDLLGRTFENLLASYNPETKTNARKQTGSFYTPREIVNYMVDESLIAYLKHKLNENGINTDDEKRLRILISYEETNPFTDEKENNVIISALENMKVLDPACGSGAFPMGILHKTVWILRKVDTENKKWFESLINRLPVYTQAEMRKKLENENWDYLRKLGIVQQSLYGVDIQPIAVQIAKLRFFISLIVDQKIKDTPENNYGLMPLPNLDFKLVCANTLIPAPQEHGGGSMEFADEFAEKFTEYTSKYFSAYLPKEKKNVTNEIKALVTKKVHEKLKQIERHTKYDDERFNEYFLEKNKALIEQTKHDAKLWQSYNNLFKHETVGFFETKYFFPDVINGFDIVIGNPPYGAYFDNETKEYLAKTFPIIKGQPESYEYFIFHSIKDFNSHNGFCSYIVPTNFIESKRAEGLRDYLLSEGLVKVLSNFRFNVWENNAAETMIFAFHKKQKGVTKVLHPKDYDGFLQGEGIQYFNQEDWLTTPGKRFIIRSNLLFLKSLSADTVPLGKVADVSQGIIVYKTKEDSDKNLYISKTLKGNNWKKLLDGSSKIEPYKINWGGNYLKYGDWLWCPREEQYFTEPKIVFIRLRNKSLYRKLIGAYDTTGYYNRDNFNNIISKDKNYSLKYLLALFNSKLINYWYKSHFDNVNINPEQVRIIPVKSTQFQKPFDQLVDFLSFVKQKDKESTFFECLIDAMVYELYLPEAIKAADCEVLKHLNNLPELKEDEEEKNLKTIEKVYKELSDPKHPVRIAMQKMQEVEEVKIIEGRK